MRAFVSLGRTNKKFSGHFVIYGLIAMRRLAAEKQLSLSLRFHKAQLEQKELGKKRIFNSVYTVFQWLSMRVRGGLCVSGS